uniref:Uncharacterized protein n=1 Tax=Nelumbo nucifera TaxID=4432 RepID=A0A822ZB87_NELNU|nr:TPA_asm: hypothetical protein HUJ06_016146 [Nelumbo nucifera]
MPITSVVMVLENLCLDLMALNVFIYCILIYLFRNSAERGRENGSSNGKGKNSGSQNCNSAYSFTFHELATATKNFKAANLIGEGGFGRVYKGRLERGHARYLTCLCLVFQSSSFLWLSLERV